MNPRQLETPPPAAGEELMNLVMRAGKLLLENGAEVFRVQQTMDIIARSYGGQDVNIYVLTNGLYCSMEGQRTRVAYVPEATPHLGRVAEINDLSRRIAAGKVPLAEASTRLEEIAALPPTPAWGQVAACASGSACFAILFGGVWADVGWALLIGVLLQLFLFGAARLRLNKIFTKLVGAGLVAALAVALPCQGMDQVIIGCLMPLTPGIALTMSIRDFINGDYLSGTIRLIDALLIAGSIACGVGLVLVGAGSLLGVVFP